MFIDSFGLYSNLHRNLISIYLALVSLLFNDRLYPLNIFPLLLSLYGSDFNDIVKALEYLMLFNKGIEITIKGKKIKVYIYIMLYSGDMP